MLLPGRWQAGRKHHAQVFRDGGRHGAGAPQGPGSLPLARARQHGPARVGGRGGPLLRGQGAEQLPRAPAAGRAAAPGAGAQDRGACGRGDGRCAVGPRGRLGGAPGADGLVRRHQRHLLRQRGGLPASSQAGWARAGQGAALVASEGAEGRAAELLVAVAARVCCRSPEAGLVCCSRRGGQPGHVGHPIRWHCHHGQWTPAAADSRCRRAFRRGPPSAYRGLQPREDGAAGDVPKAPELTAHRERWLPCSSVVRAGASRRCQLAWACFCGPASLAA
mmetsp:Transcript_9693/g.28623  ORF Transcript_9693/g.28623 Transcript_9693/m.28623 type:complete len:277 (-) Transcript_9693:66-896(-)